MRIWRLVGRVYPHVSLDAVKAGYHTHFCDMPLGHEIRFKRRVEDLRYILETHQQIEGISEERKTRLDEISIRRFRRDSELLHKHLEDCGRAEEAAWVRAGME